jgi:hypothetical protein
MKATQIVHWPGKDTAACDDHANKLRVVSGVLGVALSSTAIPSDAEVLCENCVHELKVK